MHHDLLKYQRVLIFYQGDKVCMLYFLLNFDNFQEHTLYLKMEGKEEEIRIPTTTRKKTKNATYNCIQPLHLNLGTVLFHILNRRLRIYCQQIGHHHNPNKYLLLQCPRVDTFLIHNQDTRWKNWQQFSL